MPSAKLPPPLLIHARQQSSPLADVADQGMRQGDQKPIPEGVVFTVIWLPHQFIAFMGDDPLPLLDLGYTNPFPESPRPDTVLAVGGRIHAPFVMAGVNRHDIHGIQPELGVLRLAEQMMERHIVMRPGQLA